MGEGAEIVILRINVILTGEGPPAPAGQRECQSVRHTPVKLLLASACLQFLIGTGQLRPTRAQKTTLLPLLPQQESLPELSVLPLGLTWFVNMECAPSYTSAHVTKELGSSHFLNSG